PRLERTREPANHDRISRPENGRTQMEEPGATAPPGPYAQAPRMSWRHCRLASSSATARNRDAFDLPPARRPGDGIVRARTRSVECRTKTIVARSVPPSAGGTQRCGVCHLQ